MRTDCKQSVMGIVARRSVIVALSLPLVRSQDAAFAQPQWTATVLNPAGSAGSEVWALSSVGAGGKTWIGSSNMWRGALWPSGSVSPTNFGDQVTIFAMSATQQAGNFGLRASLWAGDPSSRTDLHPSVPGVTASYATSLAGNQQTGYAFINQQNHAALWRGSAASFVDLHPANATSSAANATDGTRQWGYATISTPQGLSGRAGFWTGSAASFTSLNPSPDYNSLIQGIGGDQQVGYAVAPSQTFRAAMWRGTPESFINMHPFTIGSSYLYGTTGTAQVGWSHVPGFSTPQAGVWFGTPESFIRLSAFLPPGFGGESIATCIIEDGGRYIVGGFADGPNGQHHAILWTRDIPTPGTLAAVTSLALLSARRRSRHVWTLRASEMGQRALGNDPPHVR